jgi:hypothetical protein
MLKLVSRDVENPSRELATELTALSQLLYRDPALISHRLVQLGFTEVNPTLYAKGKWRGWIVADVTATQTGYHTERDENDRIISQTPIYSRIRSGKWSVHFYEV